MLFNKKTNKEKKSIDCLLCDYYDKTLQSCKGIGIQCVEKADGDKIQIIRDGNAVYLTVGEIKLANEKTLDETVSGLLAAMSALNKATARIEKIETDIKNIYSIIEN